MASKHRIGASLTRAIQCSVPSILAPAYRLVHVSAAPSTTTIHPLTDLTNQTRAIPKLSGVGPFPQGVQFEALGAPYSLLSVSLPSSATLYSQRGTLLGVNGKVENAISTLHMLGPLRRAALGIPFLYQKIISTTPLTCLVSTNTPYTSFVVVRLEGTVDWMVVQRKALLAWCGHSIQVKPKVNRKLSLSLWGSSELSGRGLVALVGKGQIVQVVLEAGEEFIINPNNLLAYSKNTPLSPQIYRIPSNSFRLQVPRFKYHLPRIDFGQEFFRNLTQTDTWKAISKLVWMLRVWLRRTIWGDREFLRFEGPTTILIQSRTNRVSDALFKQDVEDVAITEPGTLDGLKKKVVSLNEAALEKPREVVRSPAATKAATVMNGEVVLEDSDLREFVDRR
ncbi:mitochondrial biogenesis AIM24-domain-containing protein [Terfezia claveryi]|nr:mitochondrial biogenesis AIM24-domain-containing protein [Terfezia claveryi]